MKRTFLMSISALALFAMLQQPVYYTLDLSACSLFNSSNVYCDSSVTVMWSPSDSTASASQSRSSSSAQSSSGEAVIIAVFPEFFAPQSGTYSFTVSPDTPIPAGSPLTLQVEQEGISSITFITAQQDSTNGGCTTGMFGMIVLLAELVFVRKE